ncbi:hypothetical protein BDZ97DRAFT_1760693 [Flammula alnicola]|nr:hypothetical protein BDZ97DRAFT_1760693 [Flammula alnicola]
MSGTQVTLHQCAVFKRRALKQCFRAGSSGERSHGENLAAVDAIREVGVIIVPVSEVKLKEIKLPEILSLIYPSCLKGHHDLKEAPADPTVLALRVQLNVPQLCKFGMLCLQMEALSSGRIFQQLPECKANIQCNDKPEEHSHMS